MDNENTQNLTPRMIQAIELAAANEGYLEAGMNVVNGKGTRVAPSTIDALVRRGLATRRFSPEGGMAATLVEKSFS